ncbi:hypothetical protein AcV7_004265 [Taiwanofungus camphoratus]|nr:hypothetical protein AcV7_004265 [Antrodia cinnamomea]
MNLNKCVESRYSSRNASIHRSLWKSTFNKYKESTGPHIQWDSDSQANTVARGQRRHLCHYWGRLWACASCRRGPQWRHCMRVIPIRSVWHRSFIARPRAHIFVSLTPRALTLIRLTATSSNNSSTMSGKYIVVFKDHVTASQISDYINDVNANGGSIGQRFDPVLNGFSATIPEGYLTRLQSLQGDVIDYIEPDGVVKTQ